ncbi:HpcH/HpaI aldolase family protein [Arthrobacter sp. TMN-37]
MAPGASSGGSAGPDARRAPLPALPAGGVIGPGSSGVWCFADDVDTVLALARSGFDWLALDAQHGRFDRRSLIDTGRALVGAGTGFAVRVAGADPAGIGLALDAGAATVIVPQVDTAEEARRAIGAGRYPPHGSRSWGPLAPLWGHEAPPPAAAAPQLAVMIESAAALENVASIAAVPGVDLLFVGPFDLALSLGTTVDALLADDGGPLAAIAGAAAAAGRAAGIFAGDPGRARILRARGFDRIAVATDAGVIAAGARAVLGNP